MRLFTAREMRGAARMLAMVGIAGLAGVAPSAHAVCAAQRVTLTVLGSGGPELDDRRASSGYLLGLDGHARILIDAGSGSALHFERAGARIEELDAVLFSHLHVDHSADFPAYVKAAYFTSRARDLPVYGPAGNALMPAVDVWLRALFAEPQGAFHYLSEYVETDTRSAFKLRPQVVDPDGIGPPIRAGEWTLSATRVRHGPIPALAWRAETAGCAIVFSGDTSNAGQTLDALARDADLFVAHNAIPEDASPAARALHMPPSEIGRIAATAQVRQLLLSHRMNRTLGREAETLVAIRRHYNGPTSFAEDGQRLSPGLQSDIRSRGVQAQARGDLARAGRSISQDCIPGK